MKYITKLPFEGIFKVTYQYGIVDSRYASGKHDGIDMGNFENPNVYSICYGIVSYAGWENISNKKQGFGMYVSIKFDVNSNGYKKVFFAHLKSINVSVGQNVSPETIIGVMGSTGMSTGPHTHIEIREYDLNNNLIKKLNPANYMGIPNIIGSYDSSNYRIILDVNSKVYTLGKYKVNSSNGINVRIGPGTNYRIKKIKELSADAQSKGGYVNGTIFNVFEIQSSWGRTPSGWVSLDYATKL
ncbi:MAG: M23 family metallopeptidase [Clostridia bacterium]|nr:M23 family metallopeptidase [Clostridia bacterium]MDD4387556.1 M23 family metallopeptidase [Clostridia bacterium]